MEKRANKIYNITLQEIEKMMGKNSTTFSDELHTLGKKLLGEKFVGVYPADKIPKLRDGQYVIANLDEHDMPGSHWIGIVKDNKNFLIYDSFGRPGKSIIPTLIGRGKLIDTDLDAEQNEKEDNCGQRSIVSLFIHKYFGKDMYMLL
jgi:hypothetical protein